MANPENIEPHKFKKGQSGNPNGRPKGSLNSKTMLRKYLESMISTKNPVTKKNESMPAMEAITIALVGQALKGNVHAYNAIMDRFEGKVNQRIEMTGDEGGPVQIETTQKGIDYNKLSDEALLEIINASKPEEENEQPTKAKPATKRTPRKSPVNKKKGG